MKWVGAHVSAAGGVREAPKNAARIGGRAMGLFTRNQRQWQAKPLSQEEITAFRENLALGGFTPEQVLPHGSYLMNLAHPGEEERAKSLVALMDEMGRCRDPGLLWLNIHPGSHLHQGSEEAALDRVAACLDRALAEVPGVGVVVENTAGQGSNLGWRLEHLARIVEAVTDKERVGVCLDTCHAFAAGYDLSTRGGYLSTLEALDRLVGWRYLKGLHLNGSRSPLGSRVDRHESLEKGHLPLALFQWIMQDPLFEEMPLILETINPELWPGEIAMLYGFVGEEK